MDAGEVDPRRQVVINRGEVWWASLRAPRGSEPGFRRPVLIVQANPFNRSKIRTAIAAVLTTNPELAEAPGNVRLGKRESGLAKDSVVNVSQLVTLDRAFLKDRAGRISSHILQEVDEGLRLVLALA